MNKQIILNEAFKIRNEIEALERNPNLINSGKIMAFTDKNHFKNYQDDLRYLKSYPFDKKNIEQLEQYRKFWNNFIKLFHKLKFNKEDLSFKIRETIKEADEITQQ